MTPRHAGQRDRIVVVGSGIAGLATALSLTPAPVTIVTAGTLESGGATRWAQGGIAAALGPDDAPALHAGDTLAAGAGLSDAPIARRVAEAAPDCVRALSDWGVAFDRDFAGNLALGLEGAHSRRRIVHAGGDTSGAAILAALARAARRTATIEIVEGLSVTDLVVDDGAVVGVLGERGGRGLFLPARATVLATGGVGGLFASTTNPLGATGSGIALAARAGAVLRDLEFVQFHPTALALQEDPMPLASEAIRGEGAVLVNGDGDRFMSDVPGGELAPRDVVARAIWEQIAAGQEVFLDARGALGERFAGRFPTIARRCRAAGLDPARQLVPVRPAAHYHMGGVRVDATGRTSVPGLWACGEVAATGLHGANRLASNSLLEAVAFARWVATDLVGRTLGQPVRAGSYQGRGQRAAHPHGDAAGESRRTVRRLMEHNVGVVRHEAGLKAALQEIKARSPSAVEEVGPTANAALVGLLITVAALQRTESRGAHFRRDHPRAVPAWQRHTDLTVGEACTLARSLQEEDRRQAAAAA